MNKLKILLALFTVTFCGYSQDLSVKYSNTIKVDDLKAHLTIVASDSFEGRNTGEKGQKLAAHYIANQFQLAGLSPVVKAGDSLSYLQKFNVYRKTWNDPYLLINNKRREFMKDFFSIGKPNIPTEEELDVVFVGYGGEEIIKKKDIDIKGKVVILFMNKINEKDSASRIKRGFNMILSSNYSNRLNSFLQNGARAVFVTTGKDDILFTSFINNFRCVLDENEVTMTNEQGLLYNNTFFIPGSAAAEFLGISAEELIVLYNSENTDLKKVSKKLKPLKVKIRADKKVDMLETENVLGFIEGSDKKEEVIVITAHYDHEGIKCGRIYNGADDDGSGTVAILEMANAFSLAKKEGKGPRRSILFMTVTGEEKGLLGSEYYTKNPIFPLAQTIANLNIDMIGRIDNHHDNDNYIYLIGSNRLSTKLHSVSEEVNGKYTSMFLDYKYNAPDDPNQFYYRSDHYNFAKNNIPVIFYFSGTHPDYHRHTDDVEKIIFPKVEKTAKLIFHTAWELANMEERITVDVPK